MLVVLVMGCLYDVVNFSLGVFTGGHGGYLNCLVHAVSFGCWVSLLDLFAVQVCWLCFAR